MSLYLIRHGQTVWNREGRLQGRHDSPLTRRGVELAIAYGVLLAERLHAQGIAPSELAIHASPLGRAHQTAALIADGLGVAASDIRLDPLLAEHDVGDFAGRTWDEIAREEGTTRDALRDWHFVPPGGESRKQLLDRARQWLGTPRTARGTLVVSHGGFSRALRGAWLELGLDEILALPPHEHGRLFQLEPGAIETLVLEGHVPPVEQLLG